MNCVRFSIVDYVIWAPDLATKTDWRAWGNDKFDIQGGQDGQLKQMPPMLRRRVGALGKLAIEAAYQCAKSASVPVIFCSQHGELSRAVSLLKELAMGEPLSPTSFGLAVHNAFAGLFSIARQDHSNHLALSGGIATIEHAFIEACGLIEDGAAQVLLVAYDAPLPDVFAQFSEDNETSFAWAWMISAASEENEYSLSWSESIHEADKDRTNLNVPASLDVLKFFLSEQTVLQRSLGTQNWCWSKHV